MDKRREIRVGAVLSYMQIAAQMIVNFMFTPLMLRILGQSEYGLYSTATSMISTLSILSLGFSSSYIKKYSEYKSKNDENAIYGLNGLYLVIFSVIGSVALICGLLISINVKAIYANGFTQSELDKVQVLMLLLTINLAINFPLSVFNSIIGAHESFIFQKLVYTLKVVVGPLAMIPVLLLGYASVGMVLTTIAVTLIADGINIYYCFSKLHVKFKFSEWEPGVLKQLFKYTSFIALNIIIDQINWNIDKVIIGRYRGTSSVAIYSVGHTIHGCYMSMGNNLSNLFIPKVHAIANKYKKNIELCSREFTELFISVGRVQYLILSLICSGFIFFGKEFIRVWAGEGYGNAYYVGLLLMIPSMIPFIQMMGVEMQRALDKHQFRSLFYFGMAISNLTASIFLCKLWGEIGSALGTCVALIVADGIGMNFYYKYALKIDVITFWKQIAQMSVGLILPAAFGCICLFVWDNVSLPIYVCQIGVYTIIFMCSAYLLSMNTFEKNLTGSVIKKIIKKR